MDNMKSPGNDIIHYRNVANYSACIQKCKDDKRCSVWTYVEATCFMKNENTFRRFDTPHITGGIKDCGTKGKQASYAKSVKCSKYYLTLLIYG